MMCGKCLVCREYEETIAELHKKNSDLKAALKYKWRNEFGPGDFVKYESDGESGKGIVADVITRVFVTTKGKQKHQEFDSYNLEKLTMDDWEAQ